MRPTPHSIASALVWLLVTALAMSADGCRGNEPIPEPSIRFIGPADVQAPLGTIARFEVTIEPWQGWEGVDAAKYEWQRRDTPFARWTTVVDGGTVPLSSMPIVLEVGPVTVQDQAVAYRLGATGKDAEGVSLGDFGTSRMATLTVLAETPSSPYRYVRVRYDGDAEEVALDAVALHSGTNTPVFFAEIHAASAGVDANRALGAPDAQCDDVPRDQWNDEGVARLTMPGTSIVGSFAGSASIEPGSEIVVHVCSAPATGSVDEIGGVYSVAVSYLPDAPEAAWVTLVSGSVGPATVVVPNLPAPPASD